MPKAQTQKITFHTLIGSLPFQQRRALKDFIVRKLRGEGIALDHLSYVFCNDEYLLGINRDFLQHDFYTDIVTFDLSDGEELTGEIYISVDRVRENAATYKKSFKEEIHRVIFHGALHLCGYKDKTKKEEGLMREMEEKWLRAYGKSIRELGD